jgi:hypothetical protein
MESELSDKIIRANQISDLQYFTAKHVILNDYRVFIHNPHLVNNYANSGIKQFTLFIHDDMSYLKKEDIFLIKQRLSLFNVINLHPNNNKIFEKNLRIAIPKTKNTSKIKNDKILILDKNHDKILTDIIYDMGGVSKIEVLIDFSKYMDYNKLVEYFSTYALIICSNILDSYVAISSGSSAIFMKDIIEQKTINSKNIMNSNNTSLNYDFKTFANQLKKAMLL